jgi:type I restriction enzyme, S subunit
MTNSMKETGVDWLGKVPASWSLLRLGSLFKCRNVKVDDKTFLPLSVSKGGVVPQMETVAKTDANDNRKQVLKGDFVINSRSDRKQSCGVSALDGSVSLINTVLYPTTKMLDQEYIGYLLKNYGFAEEFYRWGHGIVADLWTTRWQEMSCIVLPIPSISEQKAIVESLNRKTSAIDGLIDNEREQVQKLREYRQALVTKVVTKGTRAYSESKNSGIDWIGTIPSTWEALKIKVVASVRDEKYTSGTFDYVALENVESMTGGYVSTDTNSFYSLEASRVAEKNDVIYGKLRPYLAKAFLIQKECCVSSEFAVFTCGKKVLPRFLEYVFLSSGFTEVVNSSTYGTKMPRANIGFINNVVIPIPPVEDQASIVDFLDEKLIKIEKLIRCREEAIDKLASYRQSLIYETVTGKKGA